VGPVRLVLAGAASLLALAGGRVASASPPGCPPSAAAVHLRQYGPAARADVDADGVVDRAWIAAQPSAPRFCGILLAVRTRRGLAVARVPGNEVGPASVSLAKGLPRLFGLLRLGDAPDLEPVVIVDRGINAVAFAAYRLVGNRLARVVVAGTADNQLDWADGSTEFGSVDCVGAKASTRVRDAFAEQQADRSWLLTGHTYRLSDSQLTAEKALSAVVPSRPREPTGLPFAHCAGLRAGG
jgi:hypothetical protein